MNNLLNLDRFLSVLMEMADNIEEEYKLHLADSGHYTTEYALIDSVHTQVVANGTAYDVTITLNDYWKYVEYDTRPHFPPVDKLLEWVKIKPIIPKPGVDGRVPTQEELAYLIGRKISKVGTKGSHDLERVVERTVPWYRERLSEALGHDIEDYILRALS